jgi:PAS domain S-box-containing protein
MPPGPNGVWAAERIRAIDPHIQIVFATAFSDISPAEIMRAVPPADRLLYIKKPVHPEELRQLTASLVARYAAEKRLVAKTEELARERERLRETVLALKVNKKYRHLYDLAPHAYFTVSTQDGVILDCNPAAARLVAADKRALVGTKIFELFPSSGQTRSAATDQLFEANSSGLGIPDVEAKIRQRDGRMRDVNLSVFAEHDADGHVMSWHAIAVDVTNAKMMEADLLHASKLESVGQLAAGIAHEINTPTQYVGDNVSFLEEAFGQLNRLIGSYRKAGAALAGAGGHEQLLRELEEAEEEAELDYLEEQVPRSFASALDGLSRISTIVGAMKEFAHPGGTKMGAADINKALQATLTVAHNEYKYVADVKTELGELPQVICHVGDLNQVFLNLLVNAAHAISDAIGDGGEKGLISVSTHTDGSDAVIEVSDTGVGIPDHLLDRIFEPFFTTKEIGKGTGQGLAIAYSIIVDKHGGELTVESDVGRGTTFLIRIPIAGNEREASEEAA